MRSFEFISFAAEIIIKIYMELDGKSIIRARQTCKRMFEISIERSIWTALFNRSSLLHYRPRLTAPIEEYSTEELQDLILGSISGEEGWASSRPPNVRYPPRDAIDGKEENVLLEGGRWLLTYGNNRSNLTLDNWMHGRNDIFVVDLDSQNLHSKILYEGREGSSHMWQLCQVLAQADPAASGIAYNLVLVFYHNFTTWNVLQVITVSQKGHGLEAQLEISTRSPAIVRGDPSLPHLQGDYLATKVGNVIEITNWKTISMPTRQRCLVYFGEDSIRLLPGNRILRLLRCGDSLQIMIFDICNFEEMHVNNAAINLDELNVAQPFWKVEINTHARYGQPLEMMFVNLSHPSATKEATRLVLRVRDSLYGIVVSHDETIQPTLFLLAISPELLNVKNTRLTLGVTRIYVAPIGWRVPHAATFLLAWPESDSERADWKVPVVRWCTRSFEVHKSHYTRTRDLVDEVSGRIVTRFEVPQWDGGVPWSIIDFYAPRHLLQAAEYDIQC